MGINVGALLAPLVANYIQPRWGFHPAFFMGAIGMLLALVVFGVNQKWVRQAERGRNSDVKAVAVTEDLPPVNAAAAAMDAVPEWKRILALVVIFVIVIVFWMAFHQNAISLIWWANDHSRALPGILSFAINPLFIILFSIPLAAFWTWLDKRNLEPSTPVKIMLGMILTGVAFLILSFSAKTGGFTTPVFKVVRSTAAETWVSISPEAREHLGITAKPVKLDEKTEAWRVTNPAGQTAEGEYVRLEGQAGGVITVAPTSRVSALWLIVAYAVLSLGELMLSPMGLSLVSQVAPVRMRGVMMGGWFAATAIGNKLTGIARFWDLWSHAHFFFVLASMALFMAVVLFVLLRPLKKAMPGV